MAIKRVECGAGKLRGRDHDDTCFVVNDGSAAKDKRSGGVQQSMMAADFPRSLADTI